MRVWLYARVSTRDKDQDPETQLRILRLWAGAGGHTIVREAVEHVSARKDRPEWNSVLAAIEGDAWDKPQAVAVLRLDRAFRSSRDTHAALSLFEEHGVAFIPVQQPMLDTSTSTGRLMLAIVAAVAEFERDVIIERVKEGVARAKAEGKPVGRKLGSKDKQPRRTIGYLQREERLRVQRGIERRKAGQKAYNDWRRAQFHPEPHKPPNNDDGRVS